MKKKQYMAGQQLYVKKDMAKGNVEFKKDNEYYTPKDFVEMFGKFDYDPATTKEKAEEFGVKDFDTIETDGLKQDWTKYKRIWVNPPFSNKKDFIKKAQETYDITRADIFILFPVEFLTTKVFWETVKGATIYMPNGRINFESGLGKKGKSPAFGSVVIKIADEFTIELLKIK